VTVAIAAASIDSFDQFVDILWEWKVGKDRNDRRIVKLRRGTCQTLLVVIGVENRF
jgi:hypothetical protein